MGKINKVYHFPALVLLVLGILDIVRGFMHTYNVTWSAENIAKLDLSVGGEQLFLLGSFGISNFLTGILYIFLSRKAKELSAYIIIAIPIAYMVGIIGLKVAGVGKTAQFNGQYMMIVYLIVCVMTFIKFLYDSRNLQKIRYK